MKKILIFISVIFFIACVPSSSEKEIKINPMVKFQGNWLIIKNNDSFSYDYVNLTVAKNIDKNQLNSLWNGHQIG